MNETVMCPFCGESTEISVDADPGTASNQTFIQDCDVCCHPMTVRASVDEEGNAQVDVEQA